MDLIISHKVVHLSVVDGDDTKKVGNIFDILEYLINRYPKHQGLFNTVRDLKSVCRIPTDKWILCGMRPKDNEVGTEQVDTRSKSPKRTKPQIIF